MLYITVKDKYGKALKCRCEGWFLFGILPLYCRQVEFPVNM